MVIKVLPARHDLKVFNAIIGANVINMMNDFIGAQASPKMALHNIAMLFNRVRSVLNSDISLRVFVNRSTPVRGLFKNVWRAMALPAPIVLLAPTAFLSGRMAQINRTVHLVVIVPRIAA